MIDIGINLSNDYFNKTWQDILINNQDLVTHVILTTTNQDNFNHNINMIKNNISHINLKTTLGFHPHSSNVTTDISEFLNNNYFPFKEYIAAIGECGLDYNRNYETKEIQKSTFISQLKFAEKHQIPLFLHEREAFDDFINLIEKYAPTTNKVVHCFTGNIQQVKAYLNIGCFIGITGWICDERRNFDLKESIKVIPINKIMLETDAPYLIPRNVPKFNKIKHNNLDYLRFIFKYISEHLNINEQYLKDSTTYNALNFFNLKN